jgi:putative restriction endonuclease
VDIVYEMAIRNAAMEWLDAVNPDRLGGVRRQDLATFTFRGDRIPLADLRGGIRKPARLGAALSILTTYTPPGHLPPYEDVMGPDGLQRYNYRGTDPRHAHNRAVRAAMEHTLPLIWLVGSAPGSFLPLYPVWVVGEEPARHRFVLALDGVQRLVPVGPAPDMDGRRYVERLTRERLHQPVFRARVLEAYDRQCAMCRLRYPSLLDAAHILPDSHPHGTADVTNGLALCKLHHAAFDGNLVGVRPDLVIQVRPDVRHAVDGPMLTHGLQALDGVPLVRPRSRAARPDRDHLGERYEEFLRAQ